MTDLKITQQRLENQQMLLTIVVPDERVDKALRATAKKLAKQYRIPGFRPGKAPYHVIVSRFGREALLEEVADEMGQDIFVEAMEVAELDPYARAVLKDVSFDPLTYQVEVPLPPEVEPNNYRELRVPYAEPGEEAISEAVQAEIEQIRERFKTWQPVERPVEYGDLVTISVKVTVNDEVVLENDDWDVVPDAEEYTMAPEFDAAFIGMTVGEAKMFTATFPEESESPWEGEEGAFEINVIGIKSEELPELDAELAQEVGEYETYEELYDDTVDRVSSQLQYEALSEHREEALDAMTEEATISYPTATLDQEIHFLMDERENYFRAYGIESTEDFLRMMGKTHEEYHEELRPAAQTRLERKLVLDAIAELEQFEISDYELDQYLAGMLSQDPEQLEIAREQVAENESYRDFIISLIQREHAEELFVASAKGEEVPEPGQHPVLEAPVEEPTEVAEEDEATDVEEMEESSDESNDAEEVTDSDESTDSPESSETEESSQSTAAGEDAPEA